jgi:hypothetical protein
MKTNRNLQLQIHKRILEHQNESFNEWNPEIKNKCHCDSSKGLNQKPKQTPARNSKKVLH